MSGIARVPEGARTPASAGIGPLAGLSWLVGCGIESGGLETDCPISNGLLATNSNGYHRWLSGHGGLTLELGDLYGGLGAGFDFATSFGTGSFGLGPDLFFGYVGIPNLFVGAKVTWLPISLGGLFLQAGAQAAAGQLGGHDRFDASPYASAGIVFTNELWSMKAATLCTFGLCK